MEIAKQAKGAPRMKKKRKNQTPEMEFRFAIDTCSKNNDLSTALSLYEKAVSENLHLNQYHFNTLLYLCSNSLQRESAVDSGFRIFDHMLASKITPTEATITATARLAAAKCDGDLAFELVKKAISEYKILPRLRSYGPALFEFCREVEAVKAYEVEDHMVSMGILPEEQEIAALLKVSGDAGREERVYMYLHKLRNAVKCVSESTVEAIEGWFQSELASEVGSLNWDVGLVKDVILRNGGGWHGLGWLGKGKWEVQRASVGLEGSCGCCGERLVCIDVDRAETEKFAESISSLAMEREAKSNFGEFKEWLDNHGEFEAVVDGANIGFYQQNFADGGFSLSQLDIVVKELYSRSKRKWPLVILHNKRVRELMENPSSQELLEEWRANDALYSTPYGSNDDWYWLYAAVKLKCLLVTNDEMRDHIFELLGRNFFLKWKERHQVHFTFVKGALKLQMPPSYSTVIQESAQGSWHVPLEGECSAETSRTWLCINRHKSFNSEVSATLDHHEDDLVSHCDQPTANSCNAATENGIHNLSNSSQPLNDRTIAKAGKRKERSPSP
ncbi:hypothetical protein MRB53_013668 [Persea americana]|uniref:Uncharacterized protein n=1 Tax=Persea americana TaxID=3435 RepID=A0ACC2K909_PERAE|nr:hypothetical protein MRB53_013668 [Persea americana]